MRTAFTRPVDPRTQFRPTERRQAERRKTGRPSPDVRQADFRPAAVRTLVPGGPLVRLYGRQHIDLLRVAGALCCR